MRVAAHAERPHFTALPYVPCQFRVQLLEAACQLIVQHLLFQQPRLQTFDSLALPAASPLTNDQ